MMYPFGTHAISDHQTRKEGCTMNKTAVITLAGVIAMMLAFGIGVAKTAGPCIVGQDYGQAPAPSPESPQNRFNSFGDGWNIERGMMEPVWRNGGAPREVKIYPWVMPPYRQFDNPIAKKDAQVLVQNYVDSTNNPNLRLGQETDKGSGYEFDIVTKDHSIVDCLLVSKDTAEIHSAYSTANAPW